MIGLFEEGKMPFNDLQNKLMILKGELDGDIFLSLASRIMYATDASEYRLIPIAVSLPKNKKDVKKLIGFAKRNGICLIPRAAGTSLAGQVVGNGIIVDVGKYMNGIIEINSDEKWVRVEPGVVLDELNLKLMNFGLFFAPETSTSNRCMIGGMAGNNACGLHSLVYGNTGDHIISMKTILSDGSEAEFGAERAESFFKKSKSDSLESLLYKNITDILSVKENRDRIKLEYPRFDIQRRNTGYAIDRFLDAEPFGGTDSFNFSKLLVGSEGTLAFTTELKLNLVPLPPSEKALVCAHFKSFSESVKANLTVLKHNPRAIELVDKFILDCTKDNIKQAENRFFLQGDPEAILIIELAENSKRELNKKIKTLISDLEKKGLGYAYPMLIGEDINKVWSLRKAGLGVVHNIQGDYKPVSVIEDTSVHPEDLMDYISDIKKALKKNNLKSVFYGHISTGELHIRPMINLKKNTGVKIFRDIAENTAKIVKKYRGSLSGEHGDGLLRSEFIPKMIGRQNYELLRRIKRTWDPDNIFNSGKIVDPFPMDSNLRYSRQEGEQFVEPFFDFSNETGLLQAVEKCSGSGDCRKSVIFGGIMCPSFMATGDESNTTRARANILREFLTNSKKRNKFNHKEIYDVLDLCLSCKGCKSECPSNVDMTKYKAEFLHHYYLSNGIPLRTRLIGYISFVNKIGSVFPSLYNFILSNRRISTIIKKTIGFAPARSVPLLSKITLRMWARKNLSNKKNEGKTVYLFADEFTNYNDTEIGIKAINILTKLGYNVKIPKHVQSGRVLFSKGMLRKAKVIVRKNINYLKDIITYDSPLIGIEPSAILSFRDEYPDISGMDLRNDAKELGENCLMFDEFISREIDTGNIKSNRFTDKYLKIKLHGHCHQKSIASTASTKKMLSLPLNYVVEEIPSGCCGMAGSFGFETEHYDLSMKVGELVLFPEVRETSESVIISAPGTSCRQHIEDGTGKKAFHPIEILYDALLLK